MAERVEEQQHPVEDPDHDLSGNAAAINDQDFTGEITSDADPVTTSITIVTEPTDHPTSADLTVQPHTQDPTDHLSRPQAQENQQQQQQEHDRGNQQQNEESPAHQGQLHDPSSNEHLQQSQEQPQLRLQQEQSEGYRHDQPLQFHPESAHQAREPSIDRHDGQVIQNVGQNPDSDHPPHTGGNGQSNDDDATNGQVEQQNDPAAPFLASFLAQAQAQNAKLGSTGDMIRGEDGIVPQPDEAALVAAAAAMAAAQGHSLAGHANAVEESDVSKQAEVLASLSSAELGPYFLAAAAGFQQQQQQHEGGAEAAGGVGLHPEEAGPQAVPLCSPYHSDLSPFPLGLGKRVVSGLAAREQDRSMGNGASEDTGKYGGQSGIQIGLGKTRCYWAILTTPPGPTPEDSVMRPQEDLRFVYLDPVLQHHLDAQADAMVGSSFFDYVHPEEKDRASDDMKKIVESRTLFGSVTRCRYSRIPRIREMLGAIDPPRDEEAHKYVEDDNFVAIDIVINWIGDDMALCFFHAIIDKGPEDNDENNRTDWTNWCGTPAEAFDVEQCAKMWMQVKARKDLTPDPSGPAHVFQVLQAGETGDVLFSWPPPRLFPKDASEVAISGSEAITYNDGSYFADDFARLAQGVSIAPGSSQLSDANTSCTRRFRAKHTLATEGLIRSIESVLIPYGHIVLACFNTTFQQQLPRADPRLFEHAKASVEAAQGRTRKAEDDASGPNKRARDANWNSQDAAQNLIYHSQQQQQQFARPEAGENSASEAQWNGHNFDSSSLDPALGSLNSLANASLGYASYHGGEEAQNGQNPQQNGTSHGNAGFNTSGRPGYDERNPPMSGLGGANDPGGSVATLAAVAAAAAAQTKSCTGCGTSNSPEWRRGPTGHKTLCNACGLRYSRSLSRRPKKKGKDGQIEYIEPTGDPSVVPKSRGGGGGSLPGTHRKTSKKKKLEAEAAARAAAAAAAAAGGDSTSASAASPQISGLLPGSDTRDANGRAHVQIKTSQDAGDTSMSQPGDVTVGDTTMGDTTTGDSIVGDSTIGDTSYITTSGPDASISVHYPSVAASSADVSGTSHFVFDPSVGGSQFHSQPLPPTSEPAGNDESAVAIDPSISADPIQSYSASFSAVNIPSEESEASAAVNHQHGQTGACSGSSETQQDPSSEAHQEAMPSYDGQRGQEEAQVKEQSEQGPAILGSDSVIAENVPQAASANEHQAAQAHGQDSFTADQAHGLESLSSHAIKEQLADGRASHVDPGPEGQQDGTKVEPAFQAIPQADTGAEHVHDPEHDHQLPADHANLETPEPAPQEDPKKPTEAATSFPEEEGQLASEMNESQATAPEPSATSGQAGAAASVAAT
ncbi:hypothetical protein IE53DRAFT_87207 [Violaceomyces palustris]|uniref:Uncharacterized protein n=1 Tax=Violaceomyces palustris TaxID=1673888 RepID=A0ACD0NXU9_9BASI|nr:hypothetical protein IE53DRAFT_87207 [Violaceomyces palustris]